MLKKLFFILNTKGEKKFFTLIIILMTIAGFLEFLSIGLLVPFITFLVDPDLFLNNSYAAKYLPSSVLQLDKQEITFLCLGVVLFIFLFKTIYLVTYHYIKNHFVFFVSDNLSKKFFANYLFRPYSFHLKNNSSNFILNCINEIAIFVDNILRSGLELISELVVVLFLISLLFLANPYVSINVIIISSILFIVFRLITKSKLKKWGYERQSSESKMIKNIQEAHDGIKEIIIFLREKLFIEAYFDTIKVRTTANIKYQTTVDIPKNILEFLAVVVFIFFILLIFKTEKNYTNILPLVGLYAAVFFKLLPSLNRIIIANQNLSRGKPSINKIIDEMNDYKKNEKKILKLLEEDEKIDPVTFKKDIILKDINFKYDNKNNYIIKNLNLKINKGETIGIVGQSGEGKSTLVNILCGFLKPETGEVLVDSGNIENNIRGWRSILGYIPQQSYLFDTSIANNISLDYKFIDDEKVSQSIEASQISSFIYNLPNGANSNIGENAKLISGGQAQRISLARIFYKNPDVLVLDEATSSLDYDNERKIMEVIKKLKGKKTIIIISHRENTLTFCDTIYEIKKGNLMKKI